MCFIVFDWRPEAQRLLLASNRDEFYARPTSRADFWQEQGHPDLLAGRDERGGGTWLGVTRAGRWAALTNVREPHRHVDDAPSRGDLVADFLRGSATPEAYAHATAERGAAYNGFNLLLGHMTKETASLWYVSNRSDGPRRLDGGRYGLSNAALDTPWPKVERGKAHLRRLLDGEPLDNSVRDRALVDPLLMTLADKTQAPDAALPNTGVGLDWERLLSPIHIVSDAYGTRASTVLLIGAAQVQFVEQTYAATGRVGTPGWYSFTIG